MGNREYFLLYKVEDILIAKNYEFQILNNIIKVYFDNGDEIEIVLSNTITMNKYTNGVTRKFVYESEDDFLKNIESDLFKYNQYPSSDLKSYHLKYWLTFIVNLYLKVYHRVEVVNSKNIPQKGSGVIASNHMSH